MQPHHALLVALHNAEADHKPCFQERAFYAEKNAASREASEARKAAGKSRPTTEVRTAPAGKSLMIPHLLRSGIFALSEKTAALQRKVPKFDDVSNIAQGSTVEYKGARLRQYDMRVLMGLMQLAGGLEAGPTLTFHADDFLARIGKTVSTGAVRALQDSLASLRSATFVVRNFSKDKGVIFGFVEAASWDKRQCTVKMSNAAHDAVNALGFSVVPLTARNGLADGIQTAMADVIASTCSDSYDVDALADIFGREAQQFGRELREHMPALVKAGILSSWSTTRGRIHVERAAA